MQVSFSSQKPTQVSGGLLAFCLAEREKLGGAAKQIDRLLGGHLGQAIEDQEFRGKQGEVVVVHTHGKIPAVHVLLVGIGKATSTETLRRAAATVVQRAKAQGARSIAIVLPAFVRRQPAEHCQAIVEGALMGSYQYRKFKSTPEEKQHTVDDVTLLGTSGMKRRANVGLELGERFAQATILARDMVNEPSSHMTPGRIVETARTIVAEHKQLKLRIFNRQALRKMGAGALLGVARGSDQPPYLLHLSYVPAGAKRTIALVGKGITFDAGGINLKPEKGIENMKMDMAGAATILGIFSALPALKPAAAVHGIIPTCENMPSGKALKPGDVVRSMSGKTIEIRNTDAEGRVILADGLTYAQRLKPDAMIDVATLTGACIVALGEEVAGAFSNSPPTLKALLAAASQAGEQLWELPLVEAYQPLLKSDIADVDNISKVRYGGAITAALFLREFVTKTPWVHLDIAGPAWEERETVSYRPKGATGFSVRTLLKYLLGIR